MVYPPTGFPQFRHRRAISVPGMEFGDLLLVFMDRRVLAEDFRPFLEEFVFTTKNRNRMCSIGPGTETLSLPPGPVFGGQSARVTRTNRIVRLYC